MKKMLIVLMLLILPKALFAASAPEEEHLIYAPTANIVKKGNYQIDTRLYGNGGLLVNGKIGLMQRFNLGISYGAKDIIGEEDPKWNPNVSIDFKYRLNDGTVDFPATAVGYESQGYGGYIKADKRYTIKSKGFYLVVSREFKDLGGIEVHGGANYSFEAEDDKSGNMFFGLNRRLGPDIVFIADYDLGLNDDSKKSYGSGKGYLNSGLRWYFAPELALEFNFLNLLENGKLKDVNNKTINNKINRSIKITYINYF